MMALNVRPVHAAKPVTNKAGKPQMSAQGWAARVDEVSAVLANSEVVNDDIAGLATANVDVKRGPFLLMIDIREALGGLIDTMPVPGSEGGNNPDLYPIDGTKRKGSYYNDLYASFGKGKEQHRIIEACKLAKKAETAGDVAKKYPELAYIADLNDEEIAKLQRNTESSRTYGRGLINDAAALHFKLEALSEMPFVKYTFQKDGEDFASTPYPVVIRSADIENEPGDWKAFSVPQIINLDIDKAKANGGTFKALKATLRRERDPNNGSDEVSLTLGNVDKALPKMADFFIELARDPKAIGNLYKMLSDDNKEDLLLGVFRLEAELEKITSKPDLAKRYANKEAELAQGSDDEEEENEAATA